MKRLLCATTAVAAMGLCLSVATAQAPPAPAPGPEHVKLGFFVGSWQSEGEMKESPFGPAGPMNSQDRCEWFEGKFAVVCHYDGKGPAGALKGIGILGYSPEAKVYTYYGVDNSGYAMTNAARGNVSGKTWTYVDASEIGGETITSRWVMEELSPDSYSFRWETQGEGGEWNTIAQGKSTRRQTRAKD